MDPFTIIIILLIIIAITLLNAWEFVFTLIILAFVAGFLLVIFNQ